MRRLGHIELGQHKVLNICKRDDVILVALDGKSVSINVQVEKVRNFVRGDIVNVDNCVGVINWINLKGETNIFVDGAMHVYVFRDKCWIKLSDYLRGASYLRVGIKRPTPKKSKKDRSSEKKKKIDAVASPLSPTKGAAASLPKSDIASRDCKKSQNKKKEEEVLKLRVHFLMRANPSLSADLARKVVRKELSLDEAIKLSRVKDRPRSFRKKIDFLDVPGLVVPGSFGTGKRR